AARWATCEITMRANIYLACAIILPAGLAPAEPPQPDPARDYKAQVVADVEGLKKRSHGMNDMVFSFGELGSRAVETCKYLTGVLGQGGFRDGGGMWGIRTAWMATWGSGKPVIALGSDIDCIPRSSQRPGVARHVPTVEGAPGHGEGHNSGQALNITAAVAAKLIMCRAGLTDTIKLWRWFAVL